MPITTRSRAPSAPPAGALEASATRARPVAKNTSQPRPAKKVEKVPVNKIVDHGAESSDDETPLASLKKKPAVPTKASGKIKAADKKAPVAKTFQNGESEPNSADQTVVVPAKNSTKTKARPKKPVKVPVAAVSRSMEETFIFNHDETSDKEEDSSPKTTSTKTIAGTKKPLKPPVGTVSRSMEETIVLNQDESDELSDESSDEEDSPITKPKTQKKNAEFKPLEEVSSEVEDDVPPNADIGLKKTKPIVIPLKPKKFYEELEIAEPTKRGAKKKETQSSNSESTEVLEDNVSHENAASTKQPKKPIKKVAARKETPQSVEDLTNNMENLGLNEGASKKSKQKKASAAGKSKTQGKKTAKTKEADSEPESNLTKYASMDSLKNITIRGMSRSVSEDNLHSLAVELPKRPRRGATKPTKPESDSEEEPLKKTKAPRKKTGK